jgi:protein-disulfide isomerase
MKAMHGLCVLVLLAGCVREKRDTETLQRLTRIEQQLEATRADTAAIASLAQQVAELQAKLDTLIEQMNKPKPAKPARREPDAKTTYSVPIGQSPVFGSPSAKVTLVMAMDFDCPYCRRAFGTVDELRKKYGTDLRVVYKPYVVHPRTALLPAQAVCAAHKQGKWRVLADLIWTKAFDVRSTKSDAFSRENITALAKQAKLDMKRYQQDLEGVCVEEVRSEQASVQRLGLWATPSFFINGRYLSGAGSIEKFSALIDEELAKANAAIQGGGVKAEDYYEQEVVAKGQTELSPP